MVAVYPFLVPCDDPECLGTLGRFVAERLLGEGASSLVFAARDPKLKRAVALRVLKPDLVDDSAARAQFLAESRAGAAVEHRNVLHVFEVCEDDNALYAVMALDEGETLESLRKRQGDFSLAEIYHLGREMSGGLAAVHEADIVHGDLKPANVLVSPSGSVKLCDFGGIAEDSATPFYRAPEQIDGKPGSTRADLYSLGVILHELTAGRSPYQGQSGEALAREIAHDRPASLLDERGDCPEWFARLVGALLEKDPAKRPASAAEVTALLEKEQCLEIPPDTAVSRPGWRVRVTLVVVLALICLGIWSHRRPPEGTPAYIQGSKTRFETLAEAIVAAPGGATIVVRDGLHEFPSAITIDRPMTIVAAEKSQPLLRSLDRRRGTVFAIKAETTLHGLTLSHELQEGAGRGLIVASAAITLRQCRLQQLWKKDIILPNGPAAIEARASLSLVRTEIDATSTIGIRSRIPKSDPHATIRLEECAIASARALVLQGVGQPGEWQVTLSKTHFLTGSAFTLEEVRVGVPHLDIKDCVFDVDNVISVLDGYDGWNAFARQVLPKMSWSGSNNLYSLSWFLDAVTGGRPVAELRKTPPGWLSTCPSAKETGFYNAKHTLILAKLPKDYKTMPTWMASQARWTAHDLRIQNALTLKRYGNAGGNMKLVGPYRKS